MDGAACSSSQPAVSADDNRFGFTEWASRTSPYPKQTTTVGDSYAREKRMETMPRPLLLVKTVRPCIQLNRDIIQQQQQNEEDGCTTHSQDKDSVYKKMNFTMLNKAN
ncbi:hypothetical protein KIN20_029404 [Parelaphostrongylus tenuis]|uniref:Uncharacterized protein n=1 Tax=Parelaphostrongylus tenuis TaxID=148309 RepID=A0AAD5WFG5_PARTN|nr:hypothetical protein KIN20_029404 [Parelaphostrongylus tenuis]